jgi:nanoRNase/pAp phosphatase (c-di-AMP/oligoRNAs hydrolase)
MNQRYRLLTRSDFDGLVCAVLMKHIGLIEEIRFVHPRDMQEGLIEVSDEDITANLPYVEGVHLAFDHHYSERLRVGYRPNHIIDPDAPSAARVVYEYYGGDASFAAIPKDMMEAVDKGDSAQFTREEVLNPTGWILLNFIMDARTGLGRFKNFRISNYQLMLNLIDYCTEHTIDEILEIADVKERVRVYEEHKEPFKRQIRQASVRIENVLKCDMRPFDTIYAGNRFVKFALFPQANIAVQVMWGFQKQNTVISLGKSIFDRSSPVNIGSLMMEYGGGGHEGAGTCQVSNERADEVVEEIIERVKERE